MKLVEMQMQCYCATVFKYALSLLYKKHNLNIPQCFYGIALTYNIMKTSKHKAMHSRIVKMGICEFLYVH